MNVCDCPQEERLETGWGFRKALSSPVGAPVWVRVHYGCDRPLLGHGEPLLLRSWT